MQKHKNLPIVYSTKLTIAIQRISSRYADHVILKNTLQDTRKSNYNFEKTQNLENKLER